MTHIVGHDAGRQLLESAYSELDFDAGPLFAPSERPSGADGRVWRERGEWLMLGARLGADRIFFVGNDPVVVFSQLSGGASDKDFVEAYRRAWSLGRARCLFLASDDELRVYALSTPPPRGPEDEHQLTPLDVVERSADVATVLSKYHRESIESGVLFEQTPFRADGRADEQLLRDVWQATEALAAAGLPRPVAHGLIERVILVRYLEDREILLPSYIEDVASRHQSWRDVHDSTVGELDWGPSSTFVRCLDSKGLTYALFSQLATDFNGDLFVISPSESREVTSEHLILIRRLLTGAGFNDQEPLFLWAYDFNIVPVSLISTMYEQFYRAGTDDTKGTHYTPPELVEYVLSRTLDEKQLNSKPRVCDPACGSGIFLVEAFRLMVRHEMSTKGRRLSSRELRALLLRRLCGIDLNAEAIRLAAFSLYLAYLSYQNPRDIRSSGPLPKLIGSNISDGGERILQVADAFSSDIGRFPLRSWNSNAHQSESSSPPFDVVIGNPPWDEPRGGQRSLAEKWAMENELPIGDRSPSQLFLWRALSLVGDQGTVALLVAATAFHNVRSREFRQRWINEVDLKVVVDFSSTRRIFFDGAVAPFKLVIFTPRSSTQFGIARFETVRPTGALAASKSLPYASTDRRWVDQGALARHDYLWKVYTWGSNRDAALLSRLDIEERVENFLPREPSPGWGYQRGGNAPSDFLKSIPSLKDFEIWGPLDETSFEPPPTGVKRQPDERLYSGQRILVRRGIKANFGPSVRLVHETMSFRHTTYCLPMQHLEAWKAKVVAGTLISSLGRYYMFMHSASWGLWYDSVLASDILRVPIRIPASKTEVCKEIASVVDLLPKLKAEWDFTSPNSPHSGSNPADALHSLDELVFALFEMTSLEQSLVNDFHHYVLEFAAGSASFRRSAPVPPPAQDFGTASNVASIASEPLQSYVQNFLNVWNPRLGSDGAFAWRLVTSPRSGAVAAIFDTYADEPPNTKADDGSWANVLSRISASLESEQYESVGVDKIVRAVTDTSVVIVKRDNPRLWSATAAIEDAEATFVQAMNLQS